MRKWEINLDSSGVIWLLFELHNNKDKDLVVTPFHVRCQSYRLIFLGLSIAISLSVIHLSNAASLQEVLLEQQAIKAEHRNKYPYSKYFKLTLRRNHNKQPDGVFVYPGENSSLFKKSGFKIGDVVVAVDGISIIDESSAIRLVEKLYSGDVANFSIEREGIKTDIQVEFKNWNFDS